MIDRKLQPAAELETPTCRWAQWRHRHIGGNIDLLRGATRRSLGSWPEVRRSHRLAVTLLVALRHTAVERAALSSIPSVSYSPIVSRCRFTADMPIDADDFDRWHGPSSDDVAATGCRHFVVVGRIPSSPAGPADDLPSRPGWPRQDRGREALKDDSPAAVEVLLPTSADVLWHQAPAPRLGEPAIFFLERAASQRAAASYDLIKVRPIQDLTAVRAAAGAH